MDASWLQAVFEYVPQFAFALALFWLCEQNADRQRAAYQEQLKTLYDMLSQMLTAVSRSINVAEESLARSEQDQRKINAK